MPMSPSLRKQPRPLNSNRNIGSSTLSGPGPPSVQLLPWQPLLPFISCLVALCCANIRPKIFWRGQNKELERWSLPLSNKLFLSCSPRSTAGPPTSSGPRLLPFMTSSLSTTVSGRKQIFVISRCCCCNAAAALTFHRPLYFMSAIKADGGEEEEEEGREKKTEKKESQGDSSSAISSECLWKRSRLVVARRPARSPPVPEWRSPFVRALPTSPWASHGALIGVINIGEVRLGDEKKGVGERKKRKQCGLLLLAAAVVLSSKSGSSSM